MHQSTEMKVKNRIIDHGRGWCFSSIHFMDLGSDASIRRALSNLRKKNMIRRLTQGIYDYPEIHDVLGMVPPDLHEVAKTIAEKNGVQIQPSGAHAANLVGLSEQVPGKVTFLTEGPSRKIKIGNQEIIFKKTTNKVMLPAGTKEGLLIQALKNIGKEHIDQAVKAHVKKFLQTSTQEEIKQNMRFAPAWIRSFVFEIMELEI